MNKSSCSSRFLSGLIFTVLPLDLVDFGEVNINAKAPRMAVIKNVVIVLDRDIFC